MLTMSPGEFLEFVLMAIMAGWALGVATYGVVEAFERWVRS